MSDPKSILRSILKRNVDQAEVYLSSSKTLKIDVLDQKIESIDEISDKGCGIRVIKNQKLGFAFTSDLDITALEDTIDRAIENAKSSEADENNILPNHLTTQPPINLDLIDPKISEISVNNKIEMALKIEEAARKSDKRIKMTEKVSYSDSESEIWITNSNGINVNFKGNYCGGHAELIAAQNSEMESGFGLSYVRNLDDFKPENVGKEAANRAVELLGARSITSQKMPLVLDPVVGTQILGALASALSSDAVQKGKSLFVDKTGKEVGSQILSIFDNGRLKNGLATSPFDDEGVETQETKLIEAGKLNTFLYNAYTANKGKTKSTGNAMRGSFKGVPSVGPTNLYIEAGSQDPDSIIESIKKGLYVTRVMGMHTANPISGDFSIGASGIMIENGEKTYPVKAITIAGNLIEVLKAIEAVGSDIRFIPFSANLGSPTLLISNITVSGG